jgi:hypothetical protein
MIVVRLKAGLGNQMFQYAFGRALSIKKSTELGLDISSFSQQAPTDTPRSYALGPFSIKGTILQLPPAGFAESILRRLNGRLFPEKTFVFDRKYLNARDGSILEGYWQTERYFTSCSKAIREDFQLRKPLSKNGAELRDLIAATVRRGETPVSLHVRRGDYVTNPTYSKRHGFCGLGYYNTALAHVAGVLPRGAKPRLFVFSDDLEWSKSNIKPGKMPAEYVDPDAIPDYETLVLMSHCRHHIISNSTFAWWGAWLNPDPGKIVIAPRRWMIDENTRTDDVVPETWVRLADSTAPVGF